MALPSSGTITLDQMHVEAGGTSGTQCSINDADIRSLISASAGSTMSFSDFYGASSGFRFNVTVASIAQSYAPFGFRNYGGVTPFGSPTSVVVIDTNVHCSGLEFQKFPATGTPSATMFFNVGGSLIDPTTDPAYANMYFTVSDGSYTTGQLPIGSAARAARKAATIGDAATTSSSGPNNWVSANSRYMTQYDNVWPDNKPRTNVGIEWTVTVVW